jgi:acyl carrier protein
MPLSRSEAKPILERIFREVFDDDTLVLSDATSREDLPSWDSLGHIRLIGAMEETFDVTFTIDDIEKMTSVDRILDVLTNPS